VDRPLAVAADGEVVRVTLTRPDRRNAFDADLIAGVTDAFRAAPSQARARVVVLQAEGPAFSAGADLAWMRGSLDLSAEENAADALRLADMFAAIATCPLPVVARVHGAALGGGAGLACASDLAVAGPEARLGFPEVRLGIVPGAISPYVVRRIGAGAARALFLSGRAVGPDEALRLGLVDVVAGSEGLDAAVDGVVRDLVAGGPEALAACKRLLDEVAILPPAAAREESARRIGSIRRGDEAQAGLRAFLEREPPPWRS
jgi:methylglutaconyl-CoA hydratase